MRKEKINLLDTVPFGRKDITTEWIDGLAVLVYPRFRQRWLRRLFSPYFSPYLHVALEEHGTAVWRLVDGTRTVVKSLPSSHLTSGMPRTMAPAWPPFPSAAQERPDTIGATGKKNGVANILKEREDVCRQACGMRPPFLFASLLSAYCGTCIAGEERRSNEPKSVVRPPDGYGVIFLWLSKAIWDEMETKVVLRVFFWSRWTDCRKRSVPLPCLPTLRSRCARRVLRWEGCLYILKGVFWTLWF